VDVSVITTVRDGERALPPLAAALDAQRLPRDAFEWVVIDNASSDTTAAVARELGAKVVAEPVPGRARARNTGVAAARGRLLAFTDVDCRPSPEWLERLSACLERSPLAGGPVEVTTGASPTPWERLDAAWRFHQERNVLGAGWAATANLGISREAFTAVGGFDATLTGGGEDVDLCLRARAAGFGIVFCPDAVVEHPAEDGARGTLRRGFEQAVSLDLLHHRHGLTPGRYWRNPGALVRGDWALRRFGIEPADIPAQERRDVLRVARLEYAARIAGSVWAPLRRRLRPSSS
jgi:GT2 family glycosyltransferase